MNQIVKTYSWYEPLPRDHKERGLLEVLNGLWKILKAIDRKILGLFVLGFATLLSLGTASVLYVMSLTAPANHIQKGMPYNVVKALPNPEPVVWESPAKERDSPEGIDDRAPMASPKIPRAGAELTTVQYIQKFASRAQKDMRKYGVPASISLAQGIVESRSGKSILAVKCNNHFGMKCFAKRHNGCCMKFHDDSNNDSFIVFDTPEKSWDFHAKKLSQGRYEKLKQLGSNYRAWANGLKKCGYATDRNYATTLISVVERYNLQRYDK